MVVHAGFVPVVVAVLAPPFYVAGVSEILLGFGSAVWSHAAAVPAPREASALC